MQPVTMTFILVAILATSVCNGQVNGPRMAEASHNCAAVSSNSAPTERMHETTNQSANASTVNSGSNLTVYTHKTEPAAAGSSLNAGYNANTYPESRYSEGARGASSSYASGRSNAVPAGYSSPGYSSGAALARPAGYASSTRYNWALKQTFGYKSSPVSRLKSTRHYSGRRDDTCQHHWGYSRLPFYLAYCDYVFSNAWLYDHFPPDTEMGDIPAPEISFDGYLVYQGDTISGVVTMYSQEVYLEKAITDKRERAYSTALTDSNLKMIAFFRGNQNLYLARIAGEQSLWRIVHAGKLTVCDDRYSFQSPTNIDFNNLRVQMPGEQTVQKVSSKKKLIACINEVYGLRLSGKVSEKQLFQSLRDLP